MANDETDEWDRGGDDEYWGNWDMEEEETGDGKRTSSPIQQPPRLPVESESLRQWREEQRREIFALAHYKREWRRQPAMLLHADTVRLIASFCFLGGPTMGRMRQVCKRWKRAIDESSAKWKKGKFVVGPK